MNFYPFHIGDFKSHTDHLSPIEDLAYRRLLDYYYLHEKPLPDNAEFLSKRIRLDDIQAIQYVLSEFFTLTGEHWHNSRADAEIAKYQEKPKPNEVEQYAKYLGFTLDGNYFCDYYEARGWQLAQGPMKCWKAAVRTWKRNHNKNSQLEIPENII